MAVGDATGMVLVIDDEESIRRTLGEILADEGYEVLAAASGEEGVDLAARRAPDVIFLDVWLPGIDGIEALRLLRERGVAAPVVMISGHGTIETAVRATKLGAYDFVEKPLSLDRVLLVTANALRHARLERRNRALRAQLRREAEFLGRSPAVERLRAALAGATDGRPVLLFGEKGVGRRLAARWISQHGLHPDGPFLDLQVSALPRERLLRALYGRGRGGDDPGRLLLADEGTLYLENADMLPATVQESLLVGMETGEFPEPGGRRRVRSEPLVVLGLLEPPERLEERGDLSGRFLAAFPHVVEVPPLRERREDIPDLVERFLGELCREYARETLEVTPAAMRVLLSYPWPGNVRELKRVLERIVLLVPGPRVTAGDLPAHLGSGGGDDAVVRGILDGFERAWLERHLAEVGGDLERASRRLGIPPDELRRRLERHGGSGAR